MVTRRRFLSGMSGSALGCALIQDARAIAAPGHLDGLPDMLVSHIAAKLNRLAAKWDRARAAIKTPAQIGSRNRFVREKFLEMIHGLPERTPLHSEVVRVERREGYRVETVLFESRPGFWVTGSLYVPASATGRLPGIISPCGHSDLGRMAPVYQSAHVALVRAGFVVLSYDPVGQGERRQYWNPYTGETESNLGPVYEHSMPGQLLLLLGEDLTHYRVWDGMRAIDYLLTRPEVDPDRIGCTGNSGGGTLTLFISAVDERVKCAVVSEGGTSHRWPVNVQPGSRLGPSDVEQNYFPGAVHGVDLCDLHVAIAPRPLKTLIENYNPRFNETARHIRERYEQLGAAEKFSTEEATDPHGWTPKLRIATVDWFCRWFQGRPGPAAEPEFEPAAPETLYATSTGSIRYSQRGDTIFSLIHRKQEQLPRRKPPASRAEFDAFQKEMRDEVRGMLRLGQPGGPLDVRRLVTTPRKRYSVEKLEFLSEPGVCVPAWVFVPENLSGRNPATLFVHESGKQAEGLEFGRLERMAREGRLVIAVDVRGVGETAPPHPPSLTEPREFRHLFDVETALSYMTWYMNESLFGMRVADVMRSVDYALSRPDVDPSRLEAVGRGAGALWVLYAAALDPRIRSVTCENGLLSYRALCQADRYLHGAGVFIRDVLKHFDLPHVAAMLAGRSLTLASPVDAMKRTVEKRRAAAEYGWTAAAYRAAGAPDAFRIA